LCQICADNMSKLNPDGKRRPQKLSCCRNLICQTCLYRHLRSCFEEGMIGQGRNKLKCPMGCGSEISDQEVRSIIRRQNPLGIIQLLSNYILLLIFRWLGSLNRDDTLKNARNYLMWCSANYSREAMIDIQRYHQWSLVVAVRNQPVRYCPSPNCDYMWYTNENYRRLKTRLESKPTYLFYKPPKRDNKTTGTHKWVEPEFLDLSNYRTAYREIDNSDGRKMVCAKCLFTFCGLCQRPWGYEASRKSHRDISCKKYERRNPHDKDFTLVACLTNARSCPRCSMRIQRSEGCNHMICPCGKEFCYVCERTWSALHYQCVESDKRRPLSTRVGCAIS